MNKFLVLILININLSVYSFGQTDEDKFDLNNIFILRCSEKAVNPRFVFKVKDYEILIEEDKEDEFARIDPRWTKSIDIISNSKSLNQYGLEEDMTLVIVEFKDRKWKKLPDGLKAYFAEKGNLIEL